LLEDKSFGSAAVEFEKTAYGYPLNEKSSEAGYAAVYSYRQHLDAVAPEDQDAVRRDVVRSSLKFADTFPDHEKAAIVLGAAADNLYEVKEYEQALTIANKLLEVFPDTDVDVVRGAWLVIGHSSFELQRYSEAENAYLKALGLLPADDKTRNDLMDNLAASIYKQGELANNAQDYQAAADLFLRVSRMAPTSKIRPTAEYDAAAALMQLKDWDKAATVLSGFRNSFPDNPLQPEVTKRLPMFTRKTTSFPLLLMNMNASRKNPRMMISDGMPSRLQRSYMKRKATACARSRFTNVMWNISHNPWNSTWRRATRLSKSSRHRTTARPTWKNWDIS